MVHGHGNSAKHSNQLSELGTYSIYRNLHKNKVKMPKEERRIGRAKDQELESLIRVNWQY